MDDKENKETRRCIRREMVVANIFFASPNKEGKYYTNLVLYDLFADSFYIIIRYHREI